jgi:hypothetical protein
MAKISTYARDTSISGEDLLTGSNYVGVNNYQTNNFKIRDLTEYIEGQISISPQNTTLKANGGIVVEIIDSTNSLAVDLSATNITGQLANSDLANSSITINGTEVSLGGTITIGEVTEVIAGTYLNGGGTEGSVTVNHDATTRTDTASTASPSYGDNFTVIDTLTTNATGHVTAANVKTITLPASDDTTYTVEAVASTNDSIIRLIGSDSTTDDVKLIAGSNISLSTSEANDTITINSQAFGTVYTVADQTAHLALTTSSGDLVIRTDESKTYIDNGAGASPNEMANYTELQFSGINSILLTEGDGIDLSRATLTNADNDLTITNALATSTTRGGIELFSDTDQTVVANAVTAETGRTYGIQLNSDDQAVVNVPWTDTNTQNTYAVSIPESTTKLRLSGTISGAADTTDDIEFVGGGTTTVTRTNENKFTISSTDANTEYSAGDGLDLTDTTFSHTDTSSASNLAATARTYVSGLTFDTYGHVTAYTTATETVTDTTRTNEDIRDVAVAMLTAGTNITLTEDDTANTLTIDATDTNTFRTIKVDTNNDGTANETIGASEELKLIGGTNVTLAEDEGTVTITSTDTNTTNWNFKIDTGTATNISAGETVTFTSGTNITLAQNGNTIDIAATDNNDNTTYTTEIPASTTKLRLVGSDSTNEDIEFVGSGATTVTRTSASKFTISSTDTNTDTNYYLDGITKSGNTLTFSVNGATNQTYEFGANAFNSTTIPTNNNQLTNGAGYLTSLAGSTGGTLEVTGTGSWLTVEGNAANTSVPLSQGLAFGWNRSGGSNETEIIFRGSTAGHSSRLDIKSWDGSGFETYFKIQTDYTPITGDKHILMPAPGSIIMENGSGEHRLRKSYDGARWADLVSNSVGGELQLGRSNTAHVKIVTLGDSYLNGGDVGIGTTTPGTKLDVNGVITATGGTSTNWNTAYGWGNHASAGYLTSFDITTQTDSKYLRSNADDTSSGSLTVVSYKFNGNATNPTDTTATIYDQSSVGLTASAHNFSIRNYNGSSMVESARFTTSSLTVIGDIVAYGSPSDISLKENIKPIENALDKVEKLRGVTFDWKESDSILNIKEDIGFIAQDVQKVLPELVRENDNGKLSLRHQGIISVLTEAIKELSNRIKVLENGSTE